MYCIVSCSDENVSRQKMGKSTTVSEEDNPGSAPLIPKIVLSKKGPETYIQKPPSEVTQAGNADLLVGKNSGPLSTSSSQVPVAAGGGTLVRCRRYRTCVQILDPPFRSSTSCCCCWWYCTRTRVSFRRKS